MQLQLFLFQFFKVSNQSHHGPAYILSWQFLYEILRLGQMRLLNARMHKIVVDNEPILIMHVMYVYVCIPLGYACILASRVSL